MKRTPKKEKFDIFNPRPLPTVAEIEKMYEYDRENGLLLYKAQTWEHYGKVTVTNGYQIGKPVTCGQHGYVRCRVQCYHGRSVLWKSESFAVHRLIWKLETGADPVGVMARRAFEEAEKKRLAAEAKESRRYARFLRLKAIYEPQYCLAHKAANAEKRAT